MPHDERNREHRRELTAMNGHEHGIRSAYGVEHACNDHIGVDDRPHDAARVDGSGELQGLGNENTQARCLIWHAF